MKFWLRDLVKNYFLLQHIVYWWAVLHWMELLTGRMVDVSPKKIHLVLWVERTNSLHLVLWGGIIGNILNGPFVTNDNLNGDMYYNIMNEKIIPSIKNLIDSTYRQNRAPVFNRDVFF